MIDKSKIGNKILFLTNEHGIIHFEKVKHVHYTNRRTNL